MQTLYSLRRKNEASRDECADVLLTPLCLRHFPCNLINIKLEIHACSNPSPLFPNIVSTWSISGYINSERRLTLHASCYYGNTINVFFYFSEKRHKIVELFALLTTELASYKMCKVGMLFCTLKLQHGTFRESFLGVRWLLGLAAFGAAFADKLFNFTNILENTLLFSFWAFAKIKTIYCNIIFLIIPLVKEKQSLFFCNRQISCKNTILNKYKRSKQTCHILHHVPNLNQILSFL